MSLVSFKQGTTIRISINSIYKHSNHRGAAGAYTMHIPVLSSTISVGIIMVINVISYFHARIIKRTVFKNTAVVKIVII